MSTSAVSSTSSSSSTDLSSVTSTASTLGKDEFLKLLVTELSNQDPLNPMDDSDFVAQLAQFSTLEQMTNLSETADNASNTLSSSQAVSMLGHDITWTDSDGKSQTGTVSGVTFSDGVPTLKVGSTSVDISDVDRVD
mgnify:CR=1 FL=1